MHQYNVKQINYYFAISIFALSILQFIICCIICRAKYAKKFREWKEKQELKLRTSLTDSNETIPLAGNEPSNDQEEEEFLSLGWWWILTPASGSIMVALWTVVVVVLEIPDEPVPYRLLVNIALQVCLMLFIIWTVFRVTDVLVPSQRTSIREVLRLRKRQARPLAKTERTLIPVFMKYVRLGIIFIFALMIAQNLGLPIASILGGLGIAGVAVAFAASALLQNVFGTTIIVVEGLFHLGDCIKVEDVEGDVERIGFRTTAVRQADKTLTVIPNSTFLSHPVHNLQEAKPWQLKFCIHLSNKTQVERVEKFLEACHDLFEHEREILPNARIWIKEINPTGIVVRFVSYTARLNPKDDKNKTDEWKPKAFYLRERLQLSVLKIAQDMAIELADTTAPKVVVKQTPVIKQEPYIETVKQAQKTE